MRAGGVSLCVQKHTRGVWSKGETEAIVAMFEKDQCCAHVWRCLPHDSRVFDIQFNIVFVPKIEEHRWCWALGIAEAHEIPLLVCAASAWGRGPRKVRNGLLKPLLATVRCRQPAPAWQHRVWRVVPLCGAAASTCARAHGNGCGFTPRQREYLR